MVRLLPFLLAAAALLAARVLAGALLEGRTQIIVCDILAVVRNLAVTVGLLWAARAGGRWSRPWLLIAGGIACWTVAEVFWLILAVIGRQPWGSVADLFFLLFYVLFLGGVVSMPMLHRRGGLRLPAILDLAIVLGAAFALLWTLVLGPTLAGLAHGASGMQVFLATAYPVGDLLVLWAAFDLLFHGRQAGSRGTALMLAAAGLLLVVADAIFGLQVLAGTYRNGNWLGILWAAALLIIGLAGIHRRLAHGEHPPVPSTTAIHMPTSAHVAFCCLLLVWLLTLVGDHHGLVVELVLGGMLALALARQYLSLADNRRLARSLRRANEELERRVEERTVALERAHERLRHAEKLEAIGRLAGGVAHDFNNLLTAMGGHLALGRTRTADAKAQEHFDQVQKAADRAASLTRQLLAFGRRTMLRSRAVDVPAVVHEVVELVSRLFPERIRIHERVAGIPGPVNADPNQLHQVVMNLALNARDAMPDGGDLTISVEEVEIRQPAHSDAKPGAWVRLAVADTGIGMGPDTQKRIFEPFFTTKDPGAGSGLGLPSVFGIVQQSGGWIEVDSAPGAGATFSVYLSRCPPGQAPTPQRAVPSMRCEGVVLLVEDDPVVRQVTSALLQNMGWTVVEAAGPDEALALPRGRLAEVLAVISDVVMPGMDGPEMLRRLRLARPELPAVLCTGYDRGSIVDAEDIEVLAKPFTPDALAGALARALKGGGPG